MIKYIVESEDLKPYVGSEGAGGVDLRASTSATVFPGEVCTIGTGVRVEIPSSAVMLIIPRSSSVLTLANTIGVIDSDYRGEILLKFKNNTLEPVEVNRGDRVVQAVTMTIIPPLWEQTDVLSQTNRGEKGFGSTGTK